MMAYDVTEPTAQSFFQYASTRNFEGVLEEGTGVSLASVPGPKNQPSLPPFLAGGDRRSLFD
jgi:hypothetical protein